MDQLPPACLIIHDQGFTAEIPEAYLLALQNNLQQPGNEIDYIGKTDAVVRSLRY